MTYLPNVVKAYDDEVWMGYLLRLSLANECSSLAEFYDRFLYLTKLEYITRVGWGKYSAGSNTGKKKEKEEENAKNTTNEMA